MYVRTGRGDFVSISEVPDTIPIPRFDQSFGWINAPRPRN